MKNITQKQINILVDAIMKQVYDKKKLDEELKQLQEKEFKEFQKTKEYKNIVKVFEENPMINHICVDKSYFFPNTYEYFDTSIYANKCENNLRSIINSKVSNEFWKRVPNDYNLRKEIETELTIRMLGGEDVRELIADLTKQFKSKFGL